MEQLVILTLVPGDDFYDDIADAFAAQRAFYNTPPEEVVATSSDGISWATTDLTGLPVEEGGSFYISGAAVSGDSLAILVGIKPADIDPYEILSNVRRPMGVFFQFCLLYTSPSPRDRQKSRMPSSA